MRRLAAGASTLWLLVVVVVTGVPTGATESRIPAEAAPAISALPSWLHKTMHASPYVTPAAPLVPNVQPVGTTVPTSIVSAVVSDGGQVRFGLALLSIPGQTYPALSTDGGVAWHVAGPLFHVDAAQAAAVVGAAGSIRPHGAYFWGQGGNLIWSTYDEGAHWWIVGFAGGVDRVSPSKGALDAVVFGQQVKGGDIQRFLYVSKDSGRTWNLHIQLSNVRG